MIRAQNAIEDCVGKRAGHPLRDYYEIIRKQAWQENAMKERDQPKQRKRKRKTKSRVLETETNIIGSVKPQKPVRPLNVSLEEEEEEEEEEIDEAKRSISERGSATKKDINRRKKKTGFSEKIMKIRNIPRITHLKPISLKKFSVDSRAESTASLTSNISFETELTGSLADKFPPVFVPKLYSYPYHPLQKRTTNIENYLACSYLGELFHEKRFLSNMPNNPGYTGKNGEGNQVLGNLTKDGLGTLDGIQEILRTRRPFYNIKYQEFLHRSRKVELDKMNLIETKKLDAIKKLNHYFANIAKYVRRMDVRRMNKTADSMYRFCKNTNREILPDRNTVLCRLYKLLGDGTLFSYRFLPGMTEQQMITRVNLALGLPIERRISQESFYRRFKGRELNWLDLINTFEQRVRICKYSEEIIWLYHELSKFNLELKRYTLAKTYCGRCIHEARKCEDFKWAVNGYMMMTRIAVFQKNKNDVRRNLRMAINTAKNINIKELDVFLQTCLGVINEWKFEKAKVEEIFHKRQETIIQLLRPFEREKREAILLFGQMNVKPPDRRLPIIPGFVDTDEYDVIERSKEERKKKKTVSKARGVEAEHLIFGYLGRSQNLGMDF
ncbi:outer dynein arm-docking complex subunit 4-like isoform X3 [Coccinella septempunctata]|uniref:outer dynein arm-docking complex subunit 4-like isoform X3 n=1 Tax=Coccinella septempunctata TaxID=41139 RepID=UPI001D082D38|nr:outer dynein arm-docking complex subunit 4-like isoform X3 [Coccinella septempunctata]